MTPDNYTGSPLSNRNDAIRFLLGDTDPARPLLLDAEVAYAMSLSTIDALAAAQLADALAARFAGQVDKEIGDLKIALSQKAKQFHDLATNLRANARHSPLLVLAAKPYAAGISRGDKDSNNTNTDMVSPAFGVGMDDDPRTHYPQRPSPTPGLPL